MGRVRDYSKWWKEVVRWMALPYDGRLIPRAKELRRDMTSQERKLWYIYLREYHIRFQRQKTIGRFIVDFYCAAAKLVVEIDGSQHFTDEGMAYDRERTAILNGYLIKVIRFSNLEIEKNFREVCESIDHNVTERL